MSKNEITNRDNNDRTGSVGLVIKRVIIVTIFLPCIVIIARRGGVYFLILVTIMIFAGLWEFYRMVEAKGLKP
ncbi:hypothetical protein J7M07_01890, partial [bacterium]|nr:hypothetical protein [bacterium]